MCLNLFENLSDGMKYFEVFSKHVAVHRTSNRVQSSKLEYCFFLLCSTTNQAIITAELISFKFFSFLFNFFEKKEEKEAEWVTSQAADSWRFVNSEYYAG
jgi:hypothetical protein